MKHYYYYHTNKVSINIILLIDLLTLIISFYFNKHKKDKHIQICQKLKEKKRKQFDSVKMRAENLDKINLVPTEISLTIDDNNSQSQSSVVNQNKNKQKQTKITKNNNNNNNDNNNNIKTKSNQVTNNSKVQSEQVNNKNKPKPKPDWKVKHEEFLRTIRAARGEDVSKYGAKDENEIDTGNGQRPIAHGMVECPSCGRRFSDRAADRHIVWCVEKQQNDQLKANNNKEINKEAMERMKARTKVRQQIYIYIH